MATLFLCVGAGAALKIFFVIWDRVHLDVALIVSILGATIVVASAVIAAGAVGRQIVAGPLHYNKRITVGLSIR